MEKSIEASKDARGPSCSVDLMAGNISESHEISSLEYSLVRERGEPHVLLDVRVPEQYDLCSLPGAVNIPLSSLPQRLEEIAELSNGTKPVYCICRRGIASVAATNQILEAAADRFPNLHSVTNIAGGLNAWRAQVDETFPKY